MALTPQQWGRILALAWLDPTFKEKFEFDPAKAVKYLREKEEAYQSDFGNDFLANLGLQDNNVILANFEAMTWDGTGFETRSGKELDDWIQGQGSINEVAPDLCEWFWDGENGLGLKDEQRLKDGQESKESGDERTLDGKDWVRIYARIWMDNRLDGMDQEYRAIYGLEKKNYMEKYDEDPAAAIEEIVTEMKKMVAETKGYAKMSPIVYARGTTRLFEVTDKPEDKPENFGMQDLPIIVRAGGYANKVFRFVLKKC